MRRQCSVPVLGHLAHHFSHEGVWREVDVGHQREEQRDLIMSAVDDVNSMNVVYVSYTLLHDFLLLVSRCPLPSESEGTRNSNLNNVCNWECTRS